MGTERYNRGQRVCKVAEGGWEGNIWKRDPERLPTAAFPASAHATEKFGGTDGAVITTRTLHTRKHH